MSSKSGNDWGCALIIVAAILCFTAYQIAELVVKSQQPTAATAKDGGK